MTPDLAWAIPPDVECVLGQWRGAARSHAGRPCLPKLPQRAWPEGFCQHRYQSYSLPVSPSLLVLLHFSFFSHSFIYAVSFFLLSLTLLDSLSIPVFVFLCLFSSFPQMSSFPLGLPTLSRLQSPSLSPPVVHTFTFLACCFSSPPPFNLFHLCLSPLFVRTLNMKMFLSCPLD